MTEVKDTVEMKTNVRFTWRERLKILLGKKATVAIWAEVTVQTDPTSFTYKYLGGGHRVGL